ncbi:molecular chaperone GrpE [Phyllobacterium sp. YR620]|uniref:Protein GrpE n=1 Tax=Phyllobacterium pellucidum TaxID=2740464 RepID=A0A849VY51_9HYPH|nr:MULTISPECIES: nucleotide exchange factor GrpE [Phyllobacterium]MRG54516.1 nucleotide exchange factor GrpE [Phyllobacterium sp. SYP-B3895]NTS32840.1 nucleotide exchange factor GrpE [Phyllobacterium pellucidum]UGY10216.1 nucleotide exchange factor GrpE [Phyllobacterium sp. T1018]SDP34139.1 molecular chaperone GrpE [Phyllobacterium sp. YR620]SFI71551.1 molecular chaperone GrpE [Phyllobacterium sp. CL33Tsu]
MAEDKKLHDTPDLDQRDLKNPRDRDALKRAADDFLKSRKAEEYALAEEDQEQATTAELDALRAENNDLKDQLLRLAADMENLRKRTARDVHDARSYSVANFARDMLAVSDNLKRAIEAVPADALAGGDAGLKGLVEGVEMTERSMLTAMERHGVKKIEPQGQKFDPNFHQAMFEIPNADVPHNTVVQVAQAGFVIGDRVLRPALVGVSRGGPKQAAGEAQPEPGPINPQAEKDA